MFYMRAVIFGLSGTLIDAREGQYQLFKGADELLPILKRLGLKIVAFAPSDTQGADQLEKAGVAQHFHSIVTDHHPEHSAMQGLQQLLADMQVAPEETVIVGHNVREVWLGKDIASAKVIAIGRGSDAYTLAAAGADHVVATIPAVLDVIE
jgi:phosphoglycolate phosphatase-like HAD superfamily hydrolase